MIKLMPNSQINGIIKWFEKQRAYRAEIWKVEEHQNITSARIFQKNEQNNENTKSSANSSSLAESPN